MKNVLSLTTIVTRAEKCNFINIDNLYNNQRLSHELQKNTRCNYRKKKTFR